MRLTRALLTGCLLAVAATALPITVLNSSFEIAPPLTNICGPSCQYDSGGSLVPFWTYGGQQTGGQWQPGFPATPNFFSTVPPDGSTIVYLSPNTTLSQTTPAAVALGVTYTLTADVGLNMGVAGTFPGGPGSVGLVFLQIIGGSIVPASGAAPPPGFFSTFTATYTGLPIDVGKPIEVLLSGTVSGGLSTFDDVRLVDSNLAGVPEPGSMALMCTGLAAIVLFRRRLTARR